MAGDAPRSTIENKRTREGIEDRILYVGTANSLVRTLACRIFCICLPSIHGPSQLLHWLVW